MQHIRKESRPKSLKEKLKLKSISSQNTPHAFSYLSETDPLFKKNSLLCFSLVQALFFFLVTRSRRIGDSESWRRLQKKAQKLPERKERENGDAGPQMLSYCASLYLQSSSAKEVSSHTICLVSLLLDDIATDKKGNFLVN